MLESIKQSVKSRYAARQESIQALAQRLQKYKKLLPVFSFGTGIASALLMKRGFDRMPWLLGALFVTWIVVGAVLLLSNRLKETEGGFLGKLQFGGIVLAQSASQEVLFFVLPFYFWSTTFDSVNIFFFMFLLLVILATLIDPIFEYISQHLPLAVLLVAYSNFVTLNFALPVVFGLRNNLSLHASVVITILLLVAFATQTSSQGAVITRLSRRDQSENQPASAPDSPSTPAEDAAQSLPAQQAAPSTAALTSAGGERPHLGLLLLVSGIISVALALAIWLFDLQTVVPPAPLRVLHGTTCRAVVDKEPQEPSVVYALSDGLPDRIYCYTAIQAPRGLDEEIEHMWIHNGRFVNSVRLKRIHGGRKQGYRTWSFKSNFPKDPLGDWACEVRTGGNQIIGKVRFEIVE